jgi:hypothetical protein
VVVNLFALRATSPRMLRAHADPVGEDNDQFFADARPRALPVNLSRELIARARDELACNLSD